jgi:hypothetical protein
MVTSVSFPVLLDRGHLLSRFARASIAGQAAIPGPGLDDYSVASPTHGGKEDSE